MAKKFTDTIYPDVVNNLENITTLDTKAAPIYIRGTNINYSVGLSATLSNNTGANLVLNGEGVSNNSGGFVITANSTDGELTTKSELLGLPDGTLTWNGEPLTGKCNIPVQTVWTQIGDIDAGHIITVPTHRHTTDNLLVYADGAFLSKDVHYDDISDTEIKVRGSYPDGTEWTFIVFSGMVDFNPSLEDTVAVLQQEVQTIKRTPVMTTWEQVGDIFPDDLLTVPTHNPDTDNLFIYANGVLLSKDDNYEDYDQTSVKLLSWYPNGTQWTTVVFSGDVTLSASLETTVAKLQHQIDRAVVPPKYERIIPIADVLTGQIINMESTYTVGANMIDIVTLNNLVLFPGFHYEEVGETGKESHSIKMLVDCSAGDELMIGIRLPYVD